MRVRLLAALSVAALLVVVSGCAGAATSPGSPGNSAQSPRSLTALVFAFGDDTLDTQAGTLTRRPPNGQPVQVPMQLSAEDMARIGAKMAEIDFGSYPATYVATMPSGTGGVITPAIQYRFQATTASGTKTVEWTDSVPSSDPKAVQLRELATLVENIIKSQPSYRSLPTTTGGYI